MVTYTGEGTMSEHDAWAESADRSGKCDRCHCICSDLYYVGVDEVSSEQDGDWAYCASCTRSILKLSDVMGRLFTA